MTSEEKVQPAEATDAEPAGDALTTGDSDDAATAHSSEPVKKKKNPFISGVKEVGIVVIVALVLSTLIRSFVMQAFTIPSESMEDTLKVEDHILAARMIDFKRGDVVVFKDVSDWTDEAKYQKRPMLRPLEIVGLLPDSSDKHMVKRIIGMPGDRVRCCDPQQRLTINGVAIDESAYLYRVNGHPVAASDFPFEVVVPKDRVFVLGDHRNRSKDSRCHLDLGIGGFVSKDEIVGPVFAVSWPLGRIRGLGTPDVFATVPDPKDPAPDEPYISPEGKRC